MSYESAKKMYARGMSVEEIADSLRMTPQAVSNLLTAEIYERVTGREYGVRPDDVATTAQREIGDTSHVQIEWNDPDEKAESDIAMLASAIHRLADVIERRRRTTLIEGDRDA